MEWSTKKLDKNRWRMQQQNDYNPSEELRSGENLRDIFFQSPYLKRLSDNKVTPFSNEKISSNKENVSPMSGVCNLY